MHNRTKRKVRRRLTPSYITSWSNLSIRHIIRISPLRTLSCRHHLNLSFCPSAQRTLSCRRTLPQGAIISRHSLGVQPACFGSFGSAAALTSVLSVFVKQEAGQKCVGVKLLLFTYRYVLLLSGSTANVCFKPPQCFSGSSVKSSRIGGVFVGF
ncbi:hypothetical protein XENOCAPTIV_000426 [Xenoophorus captivus]|uniref:Uncharacterized protein n=1 Tax=Xenoophorus captivus TaxID=1517983 RepID=A0ABV0R798_9TELE